MTLETVAAGLKARKYSRGYITKCPAHNDRSPSLSLRLQNGTILFHCFAGCSSLEVIRKLVEMGLWEPRRMTPYERAMRAVDRYEQRESELANYYLSAAYDEIKIAALDRDDWEAWKRACREQGKLR